MSFDSLFKFEEALADYTGAPYVVLTDGCTHAIELCMRYDQVKSTKFTAYTYLSVPMLMHHLNIDYEMITEKTYLNKAYPFRPREYMDWTLNKEDIVDKYLKFSDIIQFLYEYLSILKNKPSLLKEILDKVEVIILDTVY
jgi:hypothetical protein